MKDDNINYDQTTNNHMFNVYKNLIQLTPTPIYVRTHLNVPNTNIITTPILTIDTIEQLQPSEYLTIRTTLQTTKKTYKTSSNHKTNLNTTTQNLTTPTNETPSILKNTQINQTINKHNL